MSDFVLLSFLEIHRKSLPNTPFFPGKFSCKRPSARNVNGASEFISSSVAFCFPLNHSFHFTRAPRWLPFLALLPRMAE